MEAYGAPTPGGAAGGTNDPGPIPPAVIISGASVREERKVMSMMVTGKKGPLSYPSSLEQAVAGLPPARQGEPHHSVAICPPGEKGKERERE